MVGFFRWVLGSVRFGIKGTPERLYTQCAKRGVILWGIQAGESPSAWIEAGQYRALRECARRAGCRVKLLQKTGLPFRTAWMKRRKGVPVGFVLGVFLLAFLSSRVWNIEIEGTGIPQEAIRAACGEAGLWEGIGKGQLQPHRVQQRLMQEFPEISWMTVNTRGSTAEIRYTQGVQKPEMPENEAPGNLHAAVAGQVVRVEVFAGEAVVQPGDVVLPGQLLVTGTVESGASPLVHADGKVIAVTNRTFTASIPLKQETRTLSGKQVLRRSIRIFGIPIPLTFSTVPLEGTWEPTQKATWLRINGNTLPVLWVEELWEEVLVGEKELTRQQAEAELRRQILTQQEELSEFQVLEQTETFSLSQGVLTCTVQVKCRENIAIQSEILIK